MKISSILSFILLTLIGTNVPLAAQSENPSRPAPAAAADAHREFPDGPYVAPSERITAAGERVSRGQHLSVQVNIDALGDNILNDAANEPSIAVDPTDPSRLVIGWRQFDTIADSFRQAGRAFSTDGGATWTFASVIQPGVFRSDPVLDFDRDGNFFYYSLRVEGGNLVCDTFRSTDGGQTWGPGVFSFGGDKAWVAVDRSGSIGDGHFYASWSPFAGCCGDDQFNRSVDGASSFEAPVALAEGPTWGVVAVGPDGEVYVAGRRAAAAGFVVARSTTIADPDAPLAFERSTIVDLGGAIVASAGPNPGGLLGQTWIAVDTSPGPRRGHVYLLASVDPAGADPLDVHFSRSTDAGATWSPPVRVNDDSLVTHAWQWFGMMSVAPDGRIDTIWNDTRDDPGGFDSVLYYASSTDGGATWSTGEPLTPPFDPHLGWPQQNKLGDYYDMVSNTTGVHIAYAATFNGEQDVYYLHLRASDEIFADAFESGDTSAWEP